MAFAPDAVTSSAVIPYSSQVSRIGSGSQIDQQGERMKDLTKRNTNLALALCLAVLGMAIEARADCQHVRGAIRETRIPAPNDVMGRTLSNVDGVLNGAGTSLVTSTNELEGGVLTATSLDVFVTIQGDLLTATGAVKLTPIPGKPAGEFTENATLTVTGGSGKYEGATGTITLKGRAHNLFGPALTTFNVTYQGSVCGPNIKDDEDDRDGRN